MEGHFAVAERERLEARVAALTHALEFNAERVRDGKSCFCVVNPAKTLVKVEAQDHDDCCQIAQRVLYGDGTPMTLGTNRYKCPHEEAEEALRKSVRTLKARLTDEA